MSGGQISSTDFNLLAALNQPLIGDLSSSNFRAKVGWIYSLPDLAQVLNLSASGVSVTLSANSSDTRTILITNLGTVATGEISVSNSCPELVSVSPTISSIAIGGSTFLGIVISALNVTGAFDCSLTFFRTTFPSGSVSVPISIFITGPGGDFSIQPVGVELVDLDSALQNFIEGDLIFDGFSLLFLVGLFFVLAGVVLYFFRFVFLAKILLILGTFFMFLGFLF